MPDSEALTSERQPDGCSVAVLLPVKAFREAKRRLGPTMSPDAREQLARAMANRVVDASAPLSVAVVCDDVDVAAWARDRGAIVVWEPGRGLNVAVEAGVEHLRHLGIHRVIVAHADLPRAADLAAVDSGEGVTVVPDRHLDGTNVLAIATDSGFRFSYGPGSFHRHVAEATRLGYEARILHLAHLAWDVDVPDDVVPVTTLDRGNP